MFGFRWRPPPPVHWVLTFGRDFGITGAINSCICSLTNQLICQTFPISRWRVNTVVASSDCSYLFDEVDGWLEVETKVNEFPLDSLPLVFLLLKDEHLWGAGDHHCRYHKFYSPLWSCFNDDMRISFFVTLEAVQHCYRGDHHDRRVNSLTVWLNNCCSFSLV